MENDIFAHAYNLIVGFFQGGGLFMFPIAVALTFGIAIAIERYIFLTDARESNRTAWDQILPLLLKGEYQRASGVAAASDTAIGKMLSYGLERLQTSRKREDIEMVIEECLMEVLPRIEKRTHYLSMISNIATLLGLLGTVVGLIEAFSAVANVNPLEKADLLSASISVAMNCTAFGLMTAIPMMVIHSYLQTRTTELVESLEMASVKFLNTVTGTTPAPGGA